MPRSSPGSSEVPSPGLLADEVYDRVRADIVHGKLRPNQRLVEADLATRFTASRTPVRETLQRLVLDGLVLRNRGGWVVHEHSPEEIQAIYEVRAALEGYAAFLAARRASAKELTALAAVCPDPEAALELGPNTLVDLNDKFHNGVIDAARNPRLSRLCRASREYYFNYRIARLYSDEEHRDSQAGHQRILAALVERDAQGAETRAREHVSEALDVISSKLH